MSALKAIQDRKAAEALAAQQAAEKQREEFKTPEEKAALAKADGNTAEANVQLSAAGKTTPSEQKLEKEEVRLPQESPSGKDAVDRAKVDAASPDNRKIGENVGANASSEKDQMALNTSGVIAGGKDIPKELLNTPIPTITDVVDPLTQLHTEHLSQVRTGMEGSTEALGYRFGTRDEFLVTPHTEEVVVDLNNIPEHTYKMGKVRRIVLANGKAVEADKNGYIIADTQEKRDLLDHFVSQNRGLAEAVPATASQSKK